MKKLITKYLIEFGMETTDTMIRKVEGLWQQISGENNIYELLTEYDTITNACRQSLKQCEDDIQHYGERNLIVLEKLKNPTITKKVLGIFQYKVDNTKELTDDMLCYNELIAQRQNYMKELDETICRCIRENKLECDVRNAVIRLRENKQLINLK